MKLDLCDTGCIEFKLGCAIENREYATCLDKKECKEGLGMGTWITLSAFIIVCLCFLYCCGMKLCCCICYACSKKTDDDGYSKA